MLFGLTAPAITAVITILSSGNKALKADLRRKLIGFYRIKPLSIIAAVFGFMVIAVLSILLSVLAGQSLGQLSFTEDFSFSVGRTSALLTILLAAVIEEVGWRGFRSILFLMVYGISYFGFCMSVVALALVLD